MYKATDALEADLLETKYNSTVTIAIALNDKLPEKNGLGGLYGLWIPRSERRHIAAVTRETAKEAGRAASCELINVMLSGEAGKKMIPLDDEKILTAVIAELSRYLPDISKNITFPDYH